MTAHQSVSMGNNLSRNDDYPIPPGFMPGPSLSPIRNIHELEPFQTEQDEEKGESLERIPLRLPRFFQYPGG
jgi:hypothetical protein